MKTLFLIRHAKSCWNHPDLKDIDRPLNERGLANAPSMAQRAKTQWTTPGLVLSSPARRAKDTANLMKPLWFPNQDIVIEKTLYEGSPSEVLDLISFTDDVFESVALFFHNPTITFLNHMLTGSAAFEFPTCGMSNLQFEGKSWGGLEVSTCSQIDFDYPKKRTNPKGPCGWEFFLRPPQKHDRHILRLPLGLA